MNETVDWWARGIGLAALAVAFVGLAWRVMEWYLAGRVSVKVTGTAGSMIGDSSGRPWFYRGPRQQVTHVAVVVVGKGREVTIDVVGFELSDDGTRMMFVPQPGQLPKRLARGEKETVCATLSGDVLIGIREGQTLIPYCEDSEGRIHRGRMDSHYRRLASAILAEQAEVTQP